MDPVQRAKQLVFAYNENPQNYTDDQAEQVAFIAAQLGLPFRSESKAVQKFFFDLVDNIAFGALPDEQRPVSRGERTLGETKNERRASNLALLGLLVPGAAGAKAAGAGIRALQGSVRTPAKIRDLFNRVDRVGAAAQAGTRIAGASAAMNLLEDPMGAPERALRASGLLGYTTRLSPMGQAGSGGATRQLTGRQAQLTGRRAQLPGYSGLLQDRVINMGGVVGGAPRLGPSTLLQNYPEYLRTAVNQAFIR